MITTATQCESILMSPPGDDQTTVIKRCATDADVGGVFHRDRSTAGGAFWLHRGQARPIANGWVRQKVVSPGHGTSCRAPKTPTTCAGFNNARSDDVTRKN